MYTKHFGLTKLPFENVPDPSFFFNEGDYSRVRTRVEDSLKAGRGLIVVTGPIGSGKTTLSQMIKADLTGRIKFIWIAEPPKSSDALFLYVAMELGLSPASQEKVFLMRDIREALLKINAEEGKCYLMMDESHLVTDDTLNGIRLLNNLEEGPTKLIQIMLFGQDELMDIISRPEMEPFRQRIATLEILGRMDAERIREYVAHRIGVAGGNSSIFTETGLEALTVAFTSGGIPRLVNSLCDRSLGMAYEANKQSVDAHDVYEATKVMGIGKEVFHYIVTLNNLEKNKQAESAHRSEPVVTEKPVSERSETSAKGAEKPAAGHGLKRTGHVSSPQRRSWGKREDTERKGLSRSALFLLVSAGVLIAGLFVYCWRSGGEDIVTCLLDLLGL